MNENFLDDNREHINLVFIGHVDAGKSTLCGAILYHSGMVDQRLIEKYELEAKDNNRNSWYLAYIMDTNAEERARGKTIEVGKAYFTSSNKRFTILDAPGHKNYLPNMISGVSQADVALLVISARTGEFESGFEKEGQTVEHAILAKTLGIQKLVVVINKMDSVEWAPNRYNHIRDKLGQFLKSIGFPEKDVIWIPLSGFGGENIIEPITLDWYQEGSLLQILDNLQITRGQAARSLRLPVVAKFKDSGKLYVTGKIQAGICRTGDTVSIYPGKKTVAIISIYNEMGQLRVANPGENVTLLVKVDDADEEQIYPGSLLVADDDPPAITSDFVAQISILRLPEHKSLFCAGYESVMHIHTLQQPVVVTKLLEKLGKKGQKLPTFVSDGNGAIVHFHTGKPVVMETYDRLPQLGRFTLRDDGKTIAFGKILATNGPKLKLR